MKNIAIIGAGMTGLSLAYNLKEHNISIFDKLRKKSWFVAPLTSSIAGSVVDTFLFFSIAFYATQVPWVTLALGDLFVKFIISLTMLIPFRLLLSNIKDIGDTGLNGAK